MTNTDSETLRVDAPTEHIRTITLDRPDAMNAYNERLLIELVETLTALDEDDNVRALVLTGAGDAFCAGVDLNDMPLTPDMDFSAYERGLGLFQNVVRTLRGIGTPVIAAVNGYALGAGCDTALACDFRIAGESGTMGETFIDVGFVPGDGGAYLLPRLIGEHRAKELIFTGKKLRGEELQEWDLVKEVVPDVEVLDAAVDFGESLAGKPPIAVAESKRLVNESFDVNLERALEDATRGQRICSQTHDHREAVEAFQDDREPRFEGR